MSDKTKGKRSALTLVVQSKKKRRKKGAEMDVSIARSLKERNSVPKERRQNAEDKVQVNMQDVMRMFDFVQQQDSWIGRAVARVDDRAIKHGANVLHVSGDKKLGTLQSLPVLEHPTDDLRRIILWWRVAGLCPYFVMQRRLTSQRYVRVPPPHPSMELEVTTDAYGTRGAFRSMAGYENPALQHERGKSELAGTGVDVMYPKYHADTAWDSGTLKPLATDGGKEKVPAHIRGRDLIVDSGLFLWNDRTTTRDGLVITPLRQIYNRSRLLQMKEMVEFQAQRAGARPHVWVAKGDGGPGGRRNNLGGMVGEQLSTSDLMADIVGHSEEDDENPSPSDKTVDDSQAWGLLALASIYGEVPDGTSATKADLPSLSSIPPQVHNLEDGERVVGNVNGNARADLARDWAVYRQEIANYTGEKSGVSATAEEARMEKERLHAAVDEIRRATASFWEHAYARVYQQQEKDQLVERILQEGREDPSTEEKDLIRTGRFVRVQFEHIPEVNSMEEILQAVDLGVMSEEEGICAMRNFIGVDPLVRCEKLKLNRLALPTELEKRKLDLEKEKVQTQRISALRQPSAATKEK